MSYRFRGKLKVGRCPGPGGLTRGAASGPALLKPSQFPAKR